jgi:hypothetical protein
MITEALLCPISRQRYLFLLIAAGIKATIVALIPITKIRKRAPLTARRAPNADFLAVLEQGYMEVEENMGLRGKQI